jgi:hypothetical protein
MTSSLENTPPIVAIALPALPALVGPTAAEGVLPATPHRLAPTVQRKRMFLYWGHR